MVDPLKLSKARDWARGIPCEGTQADHVPVLLERIDELDASVREKGAVIEVLSKALGVLKGEYKDVAKKLSLATEAAKHVKADASTPPETDKAVDVAALPAAAGVVDRT